MDNDLFVLVFDNDQEFIGPDNYKWKDEKGPIVMETYLKDAQFNNIEHRKRSFGTKYGKCRIAKLIFIDEEGDK